MSFPEQKAEIRITADGSHTLYIPALNEHYHSVHGALQESLHVFLHHGFEAIADTGAKQFRVFETGFGTGLNALLTCLAAEERQTPITYTTIEKYPIPVSDVLQLNYGKLLGEKAAHLWCAMHEAAWNEEIPITTHFTLHKVKGNLLDFSSNDNYHLIYFDAFAPEKQPELWTVDVFRRMFNMLTDGGYLVTYCAKGYVRRNMVEAGFKVERLPGPPGKREMLRAWKPTETEGASPIHRN